MVDSRGGVLSQLRRGVLEAFATKNELWKERRDRAFYFWSEPAGWASESAVAAIRRAVSSDSAIVLVARLESELVGFCTAYDDIESVRFGRRVWVEDLAVYPGHRSRGIGKQLLDEAKQWARGGARLAFSSTLPKCAAMLTGSTNMSSRAGARSPSAGSCRDARRNHQRACWASSADVPRARGFTVA